MAIDRFEDIKSWQEARALAARVYGLSAEGAFARDFALRDQLRRAAISIMANIAEGFGRGNRVDFIHYLGRANGSALELESHLYIARDLGYISEEQFDSLYADAHTVSRLIGGFINYLRKTEIPE